MKNAFLNLIKIKSLVTLLITICFCYGFVTNKISCDLFMPIVTMIFGFYFAKGVEKNESSANTDKKQL